MTRSPSHGAVRIAVGVLISLLCAVVRADPAAEETAALLLSPDGAKRARAEQRLDEQDDGFRRAVLGHVARWGHDPEAWLHALQKAIEGKEGPERTRLQTLIEHLSPWPKTVFTLDVVCAEVPLSVARRVGRAPTGIHPGDENLRRCAALLREAKGVHTHLARRMACSDRWTLSVGSLREVTYVKDVAVSGARASPVVGTLRPGAKVEVRPALSRDRRQVELKVSVHVTDLERPIPVVERRLEGHDLTARIQTPRVEEVVVERTVTLPLGGHCVLRLPPGAGIVGARAKERALVVLLRAATASDPIPLPEEKTRG